MARIKLNPVLDQIRGAIGNLVFKRHRGRVVVARKADPTDHPPSEAQTAHRLRFREASQYALLALDDPELLELYREAAENRNIQAYNVALGDYLNAPTIDAVDTEAYTGTPGDPIVVRARDDVGVVRVEVTITDDEDNVLEAGEATPDGLQWVYEAQSAVPGGTTVHLTVRAVDRPGNTAMESLEVTLAA